MNDNENTVENYIFIYDNKKHEETVTDLTEKIVDFLVPHPELKTTVLKCHPDLFIRYNFDSKVLSEKEFKYHQAFLEAATFFKILKTHLKLTSPTGSVTSRLFSII